MEHHFLIEMLFIQTGDGTQRQAKMCWQYFPAKKRGSRSVKFSEGVSGCECVLIAGAADATETGVGHVDAISPASRERVDERSDTLREYGCG